jgi:tetratricopeptide (TPR) repeat protein
MVDEREADAAPPAFPSGYGLREAAGVLGLSPSQIRSFVRAGMCEPRRGARGAYRFSFQDLVLLRTARDLSSRIPPRRLRRALARLRSQLPIGRELTAVRITTDGRDVVVQDGRSAWKPSSGQTLLEFDVAEIAAEVAPLVRRAARHALEGEASMTAEDWFELACDLEGCEPDSARDAYRRALELDPEHVEAHVNLGRILHEEKSLAGAEAHYRMAIRGDPAHATALFNLGVCSEDQGNPMGAVRFYRSAIESDPDMADAHMNLALVYEQIGKPKLALRHLAIYRTLIGGG